MVNVSIEQTEPYAPLFELNVSGLPSLTVITGINGSGKSRLFNAIYPVEDGPRHLEDNGPPIKVLIDGNPVDRHEILYAGFAEISISGQGAVAFDEVSKEVRYTIQVYQGLAKQARGNIRQHVLQMGTSQHSGEQKRASENLLILANKLSDDEFEALTEDDIKSYAYLFGRVPPNGNSTYFSHNFARLFAFYKYSLCRLQLERARIMSDATKDAEIKRKIDAFDAKKPWGAINSTFVQTAFQYRVSEPGRFDENGDRYDFSLHKIGQSESIPLANLSTGERIILAIALAKYNSESISESGIKLLLLDEPDAPLHPSKVSELIKMLTEVFCMRGQAVMISTHSPSTIAACPSKSLFELRTETTPSKLVGISKRDALATLSDGFIGITDEDNQARISFEISESTGPILFVEGPTDKKILTAAWTKLFSQQPSVTIINAGDADSIKRRLVDQGDEYAGRLIIGLFDFDRAYAKYDACKLDKHESADGLIYKHNKISNKYAVLLPVPEYRNAYASLEKKQNSHLCIELLFKDSFLAKFNPECTKPNTYEPGILKFIDDYKIDFARYVLENATASDMEPFRPLLELISTIEKA